MFQRNNPGEDIIYGLIDGRGSGFKVGSRVDENVVEEAFVWTVYTLFFILLGSTDLP